MRSRLLVPLVALLAGLLVAPGAHGATREASFQRGPDPTLAGITSLTGPYETATTTVPRGNGLGGGTIYYPTSTQDGTFGAVAIAPGFIATQKNMTWYGPMLASQGFVVYVIDTNGLLDLPGSRGRQLLGSLDYLVRSSAVKDRVDGSRLAVMGHSMGGGGALDAARADPALKAAIPISPYELNGDFSTVKVPSLVLAMEYDTDVQNALFSSRFYASLPATLDKAYVEVAGGNHLTSTLPNRLIAAYSLSWLKRFVDGDTRYSQFLCPVPVSVEGASAVKATCASDPDGT